MLVVAFIFGVSICAWSAIVFFGGDIEYGSKYSAEGRDFGAIALTFIIGLCIAGYSFFDFLKLRGSQ